MIRAIIVDDEFIVRRGLMETIGWSDYGIEIIGEAESGSQALRLVRELPVDLVFADITMPGMTGLELIGALRTMDPAIFTVVVTCHTSFECVREAIRQGALDYFVKTELEETELDANLRRISQRVRQNMMLRKEDLLMMDTWKKQEQNILDMLDELIWFLDRDDFGKLKEICSLKILTDDFKRKFAEVIYRIEVDYRFPQGFFRTEEFGKVKTGEELIYWLEQAAARSRFYFLESGYREEIVISVLRAVNYLQKYPQNVSNQQILCDKFSISRSYFSRAFKALFHVSFREYIQQIRIHTAVRLISDSRVPLEEVSSLVGLEDCKYFNEIFRKATGMTPFSYRKKIISR